MAPPLLGGDLFFVGRAVLFFLTGLSKGVTEGSSLGNPGLSGLSFFVFILKSDLVPSIAGSL